MPLSVTQRDHETVHWGPDRPSRLRRAAGALGFGRERPARILRAVRPLRPRRAVCHPCALTHVLLPAWSVRHRRDGTEVIIAALLDAAAGQGHRMIAARLAVARPSPRGRDPPAGERGVVRARAAGVRARSPGSGNTLDTLPRGTRSPPLVDHASCARSRLPDERLPSPRTKAAVWAASATALILVQSATTRQPESK